MQEVVAISTSPGMCRHTSERSDKVLHNRASMPVLSKCVCPPREVSLQGKPAHVRTRPPYKYSGGACNYCRQSKPLVQANCLSTTLKWSDLDGSRQPTCAVLT